MPDRPGQTVHFIRHGISVFCSEHDGDHTLGNRRVSRLSEVRSERLVAGSASHRVSRHNPPHIREIDVRFALRRVPQIFGEHEPSGLAKTPFERNGPQDRAWFQIGRSFEWETFARRVEADVRLQPRGCQVPTSKSRRQANHPHFQFGNKGLFCARRSRNGRLSPSRH
jgi:hypothetical protein